MQPLQSISASQFQAFLDAPEQLLQQSVVLQLAAASFPGIPRHLLEILVNSPELKIPTPLLPPTKPSAIWFCNR